MFFRCLDFRYLRVFLVLVVLRLQNRWVRYVSSYRWGQVAYRCGKKESGLLATGTYRLLGSYELPVMGNWETHE